MSFRRISGKKFWVFVALIAVSSVLLVFLFFGALQWFFGRSPPREFRAVTRSVDPQEVQSWALEVLQKFPNATNAVFDSRAVSRSDGLVVLTNTPTFLKRIPRFGAVGPMIVISGADEGTQRHVELVFFYGGWGNGQTILAGQPAFVTPTNSQCFFWRPGIYYHTW